MALTLRFGSFTHELGEVTLGVARETTFNAADQPIEERVSWTIAARAEGDDLTALLGKLVQVDLAYRARNRYAVAQLYDTSSGLVCHELNGPRSISGVRVVQPPSFPDGRGAEFTTYRNYAVRLEAEFFVTAPAAALVEFDETLAFSGGGPLRDLIVLTSGPPVEYVSAAQTPYECVQTTRAVGLGDYPVGLLVPAFSPALLVGADHPVTFASPRPRGLTNTHYSCQKTWRFRSAVPLVALPRPFPR